MCEGAYDGHDCVILKCIHESSNLSFHSESETFSIKIIRFQDVRISSDVGAFLIRQIAAKKISIRNKTVDSLRFA